MPADLADRPFTAAEAAAAGVTRQQLRSSAYRQVLRGVHVAAAVPDSTMLRCSALRLVLPQDAVVGLATAAWLYGADVLDRRISNVLVIAQRGDQIRRVGITAYSAQLDDTDVAQVHGIPVTSPTRTAFDLARQRDLIEAVVGVDAMLNRGGADLEQLVAYTAEHRGWRWVRTVDAALLHAETLSQSPMETRQRMRLVLAGLPRPRAQVPVYDADGRPFAFIDNGYEEWRVGADYDGEPHEKRWRYDLERQERVRDQGWWHRRYSSLHITGGWAQMVRQVGAALVAAGWTPSARDHAVMPRKTAAIRGETA